MKQLLVLLFLFLLSLSVDLKPMELNTEQDNSIHVTLKGAVEEEKEVTLPRYSTLGTALEEVELENDADPDVLNPQTILKDHDVIIIPTLAPESPRISINTATKEQLMELPGVGEGTAEAIITHREQEGLFQSLEDLMQVKGIGEAKYEKLKDRISL